MIPSQQQKIIVENSNNKLSHNRGFTLVELLVVVSILAILAVIGLTVFTGLQKNARDAKRKADVSAIADAMEVHYGEFSQGKYAGLCQTASPATYDCASKNWFAQGALPEDPQASANIRYCWVVSGTCTNSSGTPLAGGQPTAGTVAWTICATLESPAGTTFCRSNRQ